MAAVSRCLTYGLSGVGRGGAGRDGRDGALWIVVSIGSRIDIQGEERGVLNREAGTGDHELSARGGREEDIGLCYRPALFRSILRAGGNAIEGDDSQGLRRSIVLKLNVQDGIGRSVDDAPELLLARLHRHHHRREIRVGDGRVVQGDVPGRHITARRRIARNQVISDNHDAFRQAGHGRIYVLNSFDNDRAGCAAENRGLRYAVNVGMIPIQARRFILGKMDVVLKRLAGVHQSRDYFILVAGWRCIGAMVMNIYRCVIHNDRATGAGRRRGHNHSRHRAHRVGGADAGRPFLKSIISRSPGLT